MLDYDKNNMNQDAFDQMQLLRDEILDNLTSLEIAALNQDLDEYVYQLKCEKEKNVYE